MRYGVVVVAIAAPAAGCRYVGCSFGVWPYDGQTGVRLDAVIRFVADDPLPEVLPSLDGAVSLRVERGNPVPFDVVVTGPREVSLVPREPLRPETTYVATGVDQDVLRESGSHWWGWLGVLPARTTFTTGGQPQVLGAAFTKDDTLVVAFSEPVDPWALEGRITLTDAPDLTTSSGYYSYYSYYSTTPYYPVDPVADVLGEYSGFAHLVEVAPRFSADYLGGLVVTVDPKVSGLRGIPLDPVRNTVDLRAQAEVTLEQWIGEPTCR